MVAFCFPSSWSCKPETCLNDNFTLANGQLVLRDYQKASLGMDASAASNSSTIAQVTSTISVASLTKTSLMTVYATQYPPLSTTNPNTISPNMVTTSALTVRSAVIGITVGLPLLIVAIIVFLTLTRERWRYRTLFEQNKEVKMDLEFYKKALVKERLERSLSELSPEVTPLAQEIGSGMIRAEMGSGQSRAHTPHPAKR